MNENETMVSYHWKEMKPWFLTMIEWEWYFFKHFSRQSSNILMSFCNENEWVDFYIIQWERTNSFLPFSDENEGTIIQWEWSIVFKPLFNESEAMDTYHCLIKMKQEFLLKKILHYTHSTNLTSVWVFLVHLHSVINN